MSDRTLNCLPRVVIAGLSGDSGKTLVSTGLVAGFRKLGNRVTAFKKGPDYIDPAWLSTASGKPVRNLDTYLAPREIVLRTFLKNAVGDGINIVEGNRGLYDGVDSEGVNSTAELAKLLNAPVILVCNVTKTTRTVAAVVLGMKEMDQNLKIAGVIINHVAGNRHQRVVTESIEEITGIPVVGAIPKVKDEKLLPSRHLGLITPAEHNNRENLVNRLGDLLIENVEMDKILKISQNCSDISEEMTNNDVYSEADKKPVKIGFFADSAFTFYYPENLESLEDLGAELVPVSSLEDRELPELDALYIGGGFPETHADKLAGNRELMNSIKAKAEDDLPIYAECGGLIYLSKSLTINDTTYPMAQVFDIDLKLFKKPQGHGYNLVEIDKFNPFFDNGYVLKGHEFHYTAPVRIGNGLETVMMVRKGVGFSNGRDGLVKNNVWASYLHIHASGVSEWSRNFVKLANNYRITKREKIAGGSSNFHGKEAV